MANIVKKRIFIIDDEPSIVSALKEWFEFNHYLVSGATSVDEITWLTHWQCKNFNCIVTGINQPGLNGIEFTELVKLTQGPPVIVMSGYEPEIAQDQAIAAGAAAFLKKPINLQEVLKIVEIFGK